MALTDFLKPLNDFLETQTGVTGNLFDEVFNDKPRFVPHFFNPMNSFRDMTKLYSPISGPIAYAIMTSEFLVDSVLALGKCTYNLIKRDWDTFENTGMDCLISTLFGVGYLAATLASPILNLVDLVGSLVTTAMCLLCKKEEPHSELTAKI